MMKRDSLVKSRIANIEKSTMRHAPLAHAVNISIILHSSEFHSNAVPSVAQPDDSDAAVWRSNAQMDTLGRFAPHRKGCKFLQCASPPKSSSLAERDGAPSAWEAASLSMDETSSLSTSLGSTSASDSDVESESCAEDSPAIHVRTAARSTRRVCFVDEATGGELEEVFEIESCKAKAPLSRWTRTDSDESALSDSDDDDPFKLNLYSDDEGAMGSDSVSSLLATLDRDDQ